MSSHFRVALLFVMSTVLAGCSTTYINKNDERFKNLGNENSVKFEDGINYEEAVFLSRKYLRDYLSYNDRVQEFSEPQEDGYKWKITVTGRLDYFPLSSKKYYLYVSKISGYTEWNQGIDFYHTSRLNELEYRVNEKPTLVLVQASCSRSKTISFETAKKECSDIAVKLRVFVAKNLAQFIVPEPVESIEVTHFTPRREPWYPSWWQDVNFWSISIPFRYKIQ